MKKLFFLALIAIAVASSAFAGPGNVNIRVLNNFNSAFKNASGTTWSAPGNLAKATFINDNVKMEAFYSLEGELIGTTKGISMDQIPVKAKRSFAKKFSGYTVKEAILFEGADETAYFISADNETESVIVKVGENEQVTTFKSTKK